VESSFRFQLIGAFGLVRDGVAVPAQLLGSRKGRRLLKLLLVERGHLVPTDRIAEVVWEGEPPARLGENVAVLVSRLRALLGPDTIVGGRSGYQFVPSAHHTVDVDEARSLVAEAEARLAAAEPSLAFAAAAQALAFLDGGCLLSDEPDAPWAGQEQALVDALLARGRRCAWRAAARLGDHDGAIAVASAAVQSNPLDEEAHQAIMRAHHESGGQGAALAAYERLRGVLAEELGADPGPETRELHRVILQSGVVEDADEAAGGRHGRATGTVTLAANPRFVGREPELQQLSRQWADAVAGSPSLLVITGEAGIGKTSLAEEVTRLAQATGGAVARARCYEAERSLFLQPVVEAVRALMATLRPGMVREVAGGWAGTLSELVPEAGRLLGSPAYTAAPPELERRRCFEAITAFLRGLAVQRPVLLLLDDLHNAGASSVELLHFLLRRLSTDRLLVLATVRQEESVRALEQLAGIGHVTELGPLPDAAVLALAHDMGVARYGERVLAMSRGHPLFAVEAFRAMAEQRRSAAQDAAEDPPLPESLRVAVLARVRRTGQEVEELLRGAAVLGSVFDLDAAAGMLGIAVEDAARRAERALRARLLGEAGPAYEFANDLIREVLYESTPLPTRVARHTRAMSLLDGNPEAVAEHASRTGAWRAATAAWLEAGDRAARRLATRDAEQLLGRAVSAAAMVDDPLTAAQARLARGRAREALGDYASAHEDHTVVLQLARAAGDRHLEVEALERLGWTAYYAREIPSARELAHRAAEFAERAAAAADARPSALLLAGRIRHAEGDLDGATVAFTRVLAGEGEVDPETRASAQHCLGFLLEHSDRFGDARVVLEEAVAACRLAGAFRPMLTSVFAVGLASANLGDFVGALARFEELRRLVAGLDDPLYRARAATSLSWVWRELGDLERATDLAGEALEHAQGEGSEPAAHALLAAAECALLGGDEADAARLLARAEPRPDQPFAFKWRFDLRYLELRSRIEPGRAEELLEAATARGSRKYQALALAHLGDREGATVLARAVGSDYLLAQVAVGDEAAAAVERMARALPADLRERFVVRGPVPAAVASAATRPAAPRSRRRPRP
jgi:DNA-binding SARP family transcriptional activator